MQTTTPDLLLREDLKDIYDFEKRLVRAIPKMAKAANSGELRSGLMEHLEVTKTHVQRIEQIFGLLDLPAKAKTCEGMKGIIAEGEEALSEADGPLGDVAIASAARRVEHYEMAAYAGARAIAEQLGNSEVASLLQETWEEEREADEKLGQLATEILQTNATNGAEHGEDEEAPGRGKAKTRNGAIPKTRRAQG
jgi:ferritin-like metal-binding protein YciE